MAEIVSCSTTSEVRETWLSLIVLVVPAHQKQTKFIRSATTADIRPARCDIPSQFPAIAHSVSGKSRALTNLTRNSCVDPAVRGSFESQCKWSTSSCFCFESYRRMINSTGEQTERTNEVWKRRFKSNPSGDCFVASWRHRKTIKLEESNRSSLISSLLELTFQSENGKEAVTHSVDFLLFCTTEIE